MASSNYVQSSFLGGEWSPYADARIDLPQYRTALSVCLNGMPIEEGSWIRRSGTRFIATTRSGNPGRVIPFDFSQSTPYIMEFTDGHLRFMAVEAESGYGWAAQPANFRLVTTNDPQLVTSISTANPAVVTTGSTNGWATNDQVYFVFKTPGAANTVPLLCNREFTITVLTATTFSIADAITGASIDGSTFGWTSGINTDVAVERILDFVTPYTSQSWSTIIPVQAESNVMFLQASYAPAWIGVSTFPTSQYFATFTGQTVAAFTDGPYLDPPTDGSTLTPGGLSGSITITASAVTSINNGSGFLSTDVGRFIRLLSEPASWSSATSYVAGQSVTYGGVYFTAALNNTNAQPDISTAEWVINTNAALWSWAIITAVGTTTSVTATLQDALLYTTAVSTWQLGLYTATNNTYPTCGVYYEGRLFLGGAVPNRWDASVTNDLLNMSPTAPDGTVASNNAITYIFNDDGVNPILWMMAVNSGIVMGTKNKEWLVQSSTLSDPITPTSVQAHPVTSYGSEPNIEPIRTELTLTFVQRFARKVLEYFPDVFSGKYSAPNLSKYAKHLTQPGVAEIRYQQELMPVIWARCDDGSLIGCTYKRSTLFSSQGAEFQGWHRHSLGSGRIVESIAVSPSTDGTLDSLVMVTNDTVSNIRHVELMQTMFDVDYPITSAWFCDDADVPQSASISSNTITFNGFWHLNGKTVSVWCAGLDCGDALVTNGSITVPINTNANGLFTETYLSSVSSTTAYGVMATQVVSGANTYTVPCVIGFTFTSQGQSLRPDTIDQTRSPAGPGTGKQRRIHYYAAIFANAQAVSIGTKFTALYPVPFNQDNGTPYAMNQLFTGPLRETLNDDYSMEGKICWQITRPYPCTLTALNSFMQTQDM